MLDFGGHYSYSSDLIVGDGELYCSTTTGPFNGFWSDVQMIKDQGFNLWKVYELYAQNINIIYINKCFPIK